MVFIFLSGFLIFIFITFEDLEEKRLKKEKKDWKRIMGYDYYG